MGVVGVVGVVVLGTSVAAASWIATPSFVFFSFSTPVLSQSMSRSRMLDPQNAKCMLPSPCVLVHLCIALFHKQQKTL